MHSNRQQDLIFMSVLWRVVCWCGGINGVGVFAWKDIVINNFKSFSEAGVKKMHAINSYLDGKLSSVSWSPCFANPLPSWWTWITQKCFVGGIKKCKIPINILGEKSPQNRRLLFFGFRKTGTTCAYIMWPAGRETENKLCFPSDSVLNGTKNKKNREEQSLFILARSRQKKACVHCNSLFRKCTEDIMLSLVGNSEDPHVSCSQLSCTHLDGFIGPFRQHAPLISWRYATIRAPSSRDDKCHCKSAHWVDLFPHQLKEGQPVISFHLQCTGF